MLKERRWLTSLPTLVGLVLRVSTQDTHRLTLVAKKGKCLSMDNVDSSRTALQSGKENYQLNGISFHPREFENFTTKEYCRQFCKRARKLEQQNERRRNAQNMNNDGTEQTTPQPQRKDKQQKKFDIAIIDPSPPKKSDDMKLPEQRLQYYVVNFNYVVPIIEDGGIILQCCHCKVRSLSEFLLDSW